MSIKDYEKKYHITIVPDYEGYEIYTADNCHWENGLSYRGIQQECKKYGKAFIQIWEGCRK